MNRLSDDEALELLRAAMPVDRKSPPIDLWPRVRRRIDRGVTPPPASDLVLVLLVALLCVLRPSLVGVLLLHF
jgi:hypothetical protein